MGCAKGRYVTPRHTALIQIIKYICSVNSIPCRTEVYLEPVDPPDKGKPPPEDLRMDVEYELHGETYWIDTTCKSTLSKTWVDKTDEAVLAATESDKNRTYQNIAAAKHVNFSTLQLDVLGGWSKKALDTIRMITVDGPIDFKTAVSMISHTLHIGNGIIAGAAYKRLAFSRPKSNKTENDTGESETPPPLNPQEPTTTTSSTHLPPNTRRLPVSE